MSGDLALLGLLQLADTSFPSGAYTLSHGLETLTADRLVCTVSDVAEVLEVSLISRFARADLPALLWAHEAARDIDLGRVEALDELLTTDRRLRAARLAREEREGSERVGRRIVVEALALATCPALEAYEAAIRSGDAPGNSAVAFGLAAEALGIEAHEAGLAAGLGHATAFAMAALRLGLIGHRDAQSIIRHSNGSVERAVEIAAAVQRFDLRPSAPQLDVAMARHETAPARSFAS